MRDPSEVIAEIRSVQRAREATGEFQEAEQLKDWADRLEAATPQPASADVVVDRTVVETMLSAGTLLQLSASVMDRREGDALLMHARRLLAAIKGDSHA